VSEQQKGFVGNVPSHPSSVFFVVIHVDVVICCGGGCGSVVGSAVVLLVVCVVLVCVGVVSVVRCGGSGVVGVVCPFVVVAGSISITVGRVGGCCCLRLRCEVVR